jgi:AcrR family transcriptional regulator
VRKTDLFRHVEQGSLELVDSGEAVTFDAVATRAGVGKATLYRRTELRALVEEHRMRGREALTLSGLAVQIDQLRRSLENVAPKVRHHEELLRRLSQRATTQSSPDMD